MKIGNERTNAANGSGSGLAGWLLDKLRSSSKRSQPRLALVERIALAPRQSLALVEAEGRRFLVATSPDGGPTFYPLYDQAAQPVWGRPAARVRPAAPRAARISW